MTQPGGRGRRLVTLAALAALAVAAPTAIAKEASRTYTFDGFKLGDTYGTAVMKRAPYDNPCDNDPIDDKTRRFMVYGALPCRERTFPEKTTVLFYLLYSREAKYEQPIVAFAWMGGTYFDQRSSFPVKIGETAERAAKVLGAPQLSLSLDDDSHDAHLKVQGHPGHVYSLVAGDKVVGFVVGPMPESPTNEQWRGLLQMYRRYTVGGRREP